MYAGVESVTPSPSDQDAACSTLQQIAQRSTFCTASETCTQLHCSVLTTSTDVTIMPCASPPSVSIMTRQGRSEIYSHVFSQSEIVPIYASPNGGGIPLLRLNVSLAVSPSQDSMVLEVRGREGGEERSGCVGEGLLVFYTDLNGNNLEELGSYCVRKHGYQSKAGVGLHLKTTNHS